MELDDTDDPSSCRQIRVKDTTCRVTGMEMKANVGKLWREAYPELADELRELDSKREVELQIEGDHVIHVDLNNE